VRVTTAFKRLLRLEGVNVTDVAFGVATITVVVALDHAHGDLPRPAH
jgi:hypothetical protein